MSIKTSPAAWCFALLLPSMAASAQSFSPSEIQLLQAANRHPTDLARYVYLNDDVPHLSGRMLSMTQQLLAFSENELGLYDQAILGFPLKSDELSNLVLPTPEDWSAADAAETIAKFAKDRRIVMVNEAHHDANTRVLTLNLLPRLRALGFDYFAAEALGDKDPDLTQRGYPIQTSGSEYLREPLYGEIVREAIRLGFNIVPYDADADTTEAREIGQAENLYKRVFAKDPSARLLVHAGYAHIDKGRQRLGSIEPMAMRLQELTGFEPFSVDQTQFLELFSEKSDAYHQLIASFQPTRPVVFVNRVDGSLWSARKELYDANVILPPSINLKSFGDEGEYGERVSEKSIRIDDATRLSYSNPTLNGMLRPSWLTLDGVRYAVKINVNLCRGNLPCVVEAHYFDEPSDAIAADRYAFFNIFTASKLYLRAGRYRLRALSKDGKILSDQLIDVAGH
ncbi:MAG TPA: hypothetical protein VGC19_03835 [Rhodanobacter sp.]